MPTFMGRERCKWWIDEDDRLRVGRLIVAVLVVVVLVAYVFACGVAQSLDEKRDHRWLELWAYRFTQDGAWFDVARTTATLVAIPGAAIALVIAFARHRVSQQQVAVSQQQVAHAIDESRLVHEREIERQKSVDRQLEYAANESRALEKREIDRRVNEQYVQAVDQLRSDSPVARIAGMHALDRLAQDQEELRSIVVDVWCAYLRIKRASESGQVQPDEREVRSTCTRLLLGHLDPTDEPRYWDQEGVRIDLAGADLSSHWDATRRCFPSDVDFEGATFGKDASFERASLGERASFAGSRFDRGARFEGATIGGFSTFAGAKANGAVVFDRASFGDLITFDDAVFVDVSFAGAQFGDLAWFYDVRFGDETSFDGARFGSLASFDGSRFGSDTSFDSATFGSDTSLDDVEFKGAVHFRGASFGRNSTFDGAVFGAHRPRGDGTWWLHDQPDTDEAPGRADAVQF